MLRKASRLENIPPYLFMELRNKINRAKAAGVDVISLAIGDPVEPTRSAAGTRSAMPLRWTRKPSA